MLPALVPMIILFFFMGILYLTILLLKTYHNQKKRRSPFTEKFLRGPGQSLIEKLENINEDLMGYSMMLVTMPMGFYAVFISDLYFRKQPINLFSAMTSFIIGFIFTGYLLIKIVKLLNLRRATRLGYEGEVAVGQELNRLMLQGYHVYHDFVADNFNIDHLVVGPAGAFAVETKARAKPVSDNKTADARVIYDGKCIRFPKWTETKPLKQAINQAVWLERWISSATGEKTKVHPVVALPGWFVERTSSQGIFVINPKNFSRIAKPNGRNQLDEQQIKRIIYQIEQRCKNIKSKAVEGLGGR